MSTAQRFKADFSPETVDKVRDAITAGLTQAGVSPADAYSILTVADEIICNVVEHSQAHWVEVEVYPEGKLVRIVIRDDGRAFDPTLRLIQPLPEEPGSRKLGLYMVGQLSAFCEYRRVDGALNELALDIKKQA